MINRPALTLLTLAFLPAALIGFTSCSSSKPAPVSRSSFVSPGAAAANVDEFGGEVITETSSVPATVISVDPANRQVVLQRADGGTNTFQTTPAASGFKRLKPGNRVRLTVAEELTVYVGANGVPTNAVPAVATRLRSRLPRGTQVIATEVVTSDFIGGIAALDDWNDTVTLVLPAGPKTIPVNESVNLGDLKVGDSVSVRSIKAATIELDKPAK
jgi:hypothetical protein